MPRLFTDDRDASLETADGRTLHAHDHIIDVPERDAAYARTAVRNCPLFHHHPARWGGVDVSELQARYAEWERRQERAS